MLEQMQPDVCVITDIYGNYDISCKRFEPQTIPTDFICFTDNENMKNEYGWIIDTTPYHIINKSVLDKDCYINSLCNNSHTFNITKYYKTAFKNIPRLQHYKAILWIDGTLEIIYDKMSEYILKNINKYKIIAFNHEIHHGSLFHETYASLGSDRYISTFHHNQHQPYQDVIQQYKDYIGLNFNEDIFRCICSDNVNYGLWITCFVVFHNHDERITDFLDKWYYEILTRTTQDQISFPFVCQMCSVFPYTLPDDEIEGQFPHKSTMFYMKHKHGL